MKKNNFLLNLLLFIIIIFINENIFADSSITALNLYAIRKVETDALQVNNLAVFGNKITIDGNNSSISTSAASLSFGSNNLQTTGNIS